MVQELREIGRAAWMPKVGVTFAIGRLKYGLCPGRTLVLRSLKTFGPGGHRKRASGGRAAECRASGRIDSFFEIRDHPGPAHGLDVDVDVEDRFSHSHAPDCGQRRRR